MKVLNKLVCSLALAVAAASASADPIYVGSWDLFGGASFFSGAAPILSGREAAAALFGGKPADYLVSTKGEDAANIDFSAWYEIAGLQDGFFIYEQDFRVDIGGDAGVYDFWGDSSAMVRDGAEGLGLMNYAFRIEPAGPGRVPEPLSCALMGVGLAGMALARRRKQH